MSDIIDKENEISHNAQEFEILTTNTFDDWFESVKDYKTRARIVARLDRLTQGHFGDYKRLSHECQS